MVDFGDVPGVGDRELSPAGAGEFVAGPVAAGNQLLVLFRSVLGHLAPILRAFIPEVLQVVPDAHAVVDEPEALGQLEFVLELFLVLFGHRGRQRSPFAVFIFGAVEAVHVRHDDDLYRNADDRLVAVGSEG